MQIVYRIIVFILGVNGAGAALGINLFYAASKRFQDLIGLHPDPAHGWLGLSCAILAFIGAILVLFTKTNLAGGIMLLIAGIVFFFVVNWWALLASPQILLAAFFAFYYYYDRKHTRALEQAVSAARISAQEHPPQEGGAAAAG